jgi:hypothetical protein
VASAPVRPTVGGVPVHATDLVPADTDLPGDGWVAIGEEFGADSVDGAAELFDCVGPGFPDDAVVDTAASPHFVRPPRTLVHGLAVSFDDEDAAQRAETILVGADFAECLGRSVAADLEAQPVEAELLAIDLSATSAGHRVRFTGGDQYGVRPVHLDIVVVRVATAVGLLWFGDTPEPFAAADRDHVIDRVRGHVG